VTEVALVLVSIGLVLTSIKVSRLYKMVVELFMVVANIMAILEIQGQINQKLTNISDLDEEFRRMMKDM
jgi:hypothetical protein